MSSFVAMRMAGFKQSEIRYMTRECQAQGGINLGQGLCDLPTHPLVEEGAIAAIQQRRNTYSPADGLPELRRAIAKKLSRDNLIDAHPDRNIVVTLGTSGGYMAALNALLDPGDGILLFEPYYGYHRNAAIIAGLEPQFARLEPPEFRLTRALLDGAVQENTAAMVLCTPANPTGRILSEEELEVVAEFAQERDLLVITDEIYEYIRFDGEIHISPASIMGLTDRTVSLMGFSKTFSITGWRLGYAVAPDEMAKAIALVNDSYCVCAPTPLQLGVAKGLEAPPDYFTELGVMYQRKRDILCTALKEGGMPPLIPQGAYYVLADIGNLGFRSAKDAAMSLLGEVGVAAIPGSAFFRDDSGERYLRFCFAQEDRIIEEAAERIKSFRR